MLNIDEYRQIRKDYFGEGFFEANKGYRRYKSAMQKKYCIDPDCRGCDVERSPNLVKAMEFATKCSPLAPLPKAVPTECILPNKELCEVINPRGELVEYMWKTKQEGKTPMRYNDNYASASANVTTVQSDTATQRDYLLSRLAKADYPKQTELANLFNLYVDNTPKTYKDLIDAIKNDKFSIDAKAAKKLDSIEEDSDEEDGPEWYWGPLHGIVWAGPQPDRKGFNAAVELKTAQYTAAKDIIMTGDSAAGLKALQDFEAWLPEAGTKAN